MALPSFIFSNKTLCVSNSQMAEVSTGGHMSSIKLEWVSEHAPATQREVICGDANWLGNSAAVAAVGGGSKEEEHVISVEEQGTVLEEVIYPSQNNDITVQDNTVVQDFVEIQVTEEEVVSETVWDGVQSAVVVGDSKDIKNEDEVEIPLPENQDLYSQLHPYPCDFCSRRFSKKLTLMSHMISHQSERPHGCNLCGARYRRKCDLVNHMKIHAYAPIRSTVDDEEEEDIPRINQVAGEGGGQGGAGSKGRRKKAQSTVPKKMNSASPGGDEVGGAGAGASLRGDRNNDYRTDKKGGGGGGKNKFSNKKGGGGVGVAHNNKGISSPNVKGPTYADDDMRLLADISQNDMARLVPPRWPVLDQSRPYVCQHCGVGFAREKALGSHARMHAGDSPFECDVCGEMFWDVTMLREHARAKHPHLGDNILPAVHHSSTAAAATAAAAASIYTGDDRFGNFYCESCGVGFHRLDLLKRHRRTHIKGEPPEELGGGDRGSIVGGGGSIGGGGGGGSVGSGGGGGGSVGAEEEGHVCTTCGLYFENALELRTHMESHSPSGGEQHRCMACGQICDSLGEMSEHVRRCHGDNSQENTCNLCGKTCKDRRSLLKHSWVHSENRSFPCQACNKRFHSRARLRRHMMSHRDKAVNCSDCGEEFPDGRALLSHRHSHASANSNHPVRSFPCHDCGKTFGSRSSQQIHVRIHTGERPYGCRFCWKAFADGGTLRKHERIHTGEKPYVCPVCPKAFNQRVVLREHIRAHHSGSDSKVNSCYECKVCGYLFGSSSELCLHLVQHSDENTAKHRLPTVGPRKYKRRRKLPPHDTTNLMGMGDDNDQDYFSDTSDSQTEKKKIVNKRRVKYETQMPRDEYENVVKVCESALENISSMVNEDEQKKIRMEKVARKSKLKAANQKLARSEKRAKAAKLMNNTSYASKYVVSRPDEDKSSPNGSGGGEGGGGRPRMKSVYLPPAATGGLSSDVNEFETEMAVDAIVNGADNRNRPRTKNVSYHNMKMGTKLEPAMFPAGKSHEGASGGRSNRRPRGKRAPVVVKKEPQVEVTSTRTDEEEELAAAMALERGLGGRSNHHQVLVEEPNVEQENIPLNVNYQEEKVECTVVPNLGLNIKLEPVADCMVKTEIITADLLACEMCSEVFSDRTDLLNHIRIHI